MTMNDQTVRRADVFDPPTQSPARRPLTMHGDRLGQAFGLGLILLGTVVTTAWTGFLFWLLGRLLRIW
jgi:hypothetical protein